MSKRNEHFLTIICPKHMSKAIWKNYIYTLQNGIKVLCNFFILMKLKTFIRYFMMTKTLNLSNVKYKLTQFN